MTTVFISYSRKDTDFVRRLHGALTSEERQTWVDWEGIPPTAEWMQEIVSAIDAAAAFVFVMTPDSLASPVCIQELQHAAGQNKRLIPLVRRDVAAASLPDSLAKLNWIFFRDGDDFATALQTLNTAIDTDLDWVHAHSRLLVRAREWDGKGRENSLALRGKDLRAAEQWLTLGPAKQPQPTELQTIYILLSRKTATQRRYLLLGSVMAALVGLSILSTTTYLGRREAARQQTIALAGRLTADADLVRDQSETVPVGMGGLERSVLLATEAAGQLDALGVRSLQTDMALRRGLAVLPRPVGKLERDSVAAVKAIAFSDDGKLTAASNQAFGVEQWDVATRARIGGKQPGGSVQSLVFSPDGKFVATTELNNVPGVINVWEAGTLKQLAEFKDLGDQVGAVALSPAGQYLAASTENFDKAAQAWVPGSTRVWAVAGAGQSEIVSLPRAAELSFSADGNQLTANFGNNNAQTWGVGDWKVIRSFKPDASPMAVSPDGKYTAVKADDYTAKVMLAGDRSEAARVHASDMIEALAFSPNSRELAVAGFSKQVDLWRVDEGEGDSIRVVSDSSIRGAGFDAAESSLTTIAHTTAKVNAHGWPLMEKRQPAKWTADLSGDLVTFSASGNFVAVTSGQTVAILNALNGKTVRSLRFQGQPIAIALSPEGSALAIATAGGVVLLWQTETSPEPIRFRVQGEVTANYLAIGPFGTTLAVVATEKVTRAGPTLVSHFWRPPNAAEVARNPVGTNRSGLTAMPCALSADARYLATNEGNGVVALRDTQTGRSSATINHPGSDNACTFSADSRLLATLGSDVVRIWDTATQTEIARIEHATDIRQLIFSPRGRYLASLGPQGTVRVSMLDPRDLIHAACSRLTRNLTRDEWRDYFGEKPYLATCQALPIPHE